MRRRFAIRLAARVIVCFGLSLLLPRAGSAQEAPYRESPYFVTYDHYLEKPGDVEIAMSATSGLPKHRAADYTAPWLEVEVGVTRWWTPEFYFEGVTAGHVGSAVTGWRWENRFRPFSKEHRINPVLYIEYEHLNEASRVQKEIVGSGGLDFAPIADLREQRAHELEGKLILSTTARRWNIAENFTVEKNLSQSEGFEFGYSAATARALGSNPLTRGCEFCWSRFLAGIEAYGGLGTTGDAGFSDTRHYIAPLLEWNVRRGLTLKVSDGFGLTGSSDNQLFRFGAVFEF